MRKVLHNLLKFIDRFLPPEALASAETRLRFRVAVSIFLVDFSTASSSLLLIALGRWGGLRGEFIPVTNDQAMGWLLAYTVVDCLALYLTKKSYSLEKIFVVFMALSFLNSITDTILNPDSFLVVAAYSLAFPIFLACFLLTSFRSRLVILTFTCIQILVMFISLNIVALTFLRYLRTWRLQIGASRI